MAEKTKGAGYMETDTIPSELSDLCRQMRAAWKELEENPGDQRWIEVFTALQEELIRCEQKMDVTQKQADWIRKEIMKTA